MLDDHCRGAIAEVVHLLPRRCGVEQVEVGQLHASVLDDRYLVSNRDALVGVRRLMREEGLFAGLSSGAVLAVALRVAAEMERGTIVMLLADGGWKYLSTDLWTRDLDEVSDEFEGSVLW